MKKSITRSIAFITTLFMIVMITPFTLKEMIVSAASGPSNKSSNIAYTLTTLTWSGFNKTTPITISVSNSSMITDYSFNGNDTFTIRVSQNNSSSSRTGYVYAKKSGKTVAKYTIIQAGKPHTHSWSSWVTSKEPGCTTTGSKYRTCYCGAKETQMIYPKGHYMQTFEHSDATCEKPATILMKCKYCDYHFTTTIGKAKGHIMSYSYDDSRDMIIGRCARGDLYDKNVTYEDYLDYENISDNVANREKYFDIVFSACKNINKNAAQIESEFYKIEGSYEKIMHEIIGDTNGLPSLTPTGGNVFEVFDQLNTYQMIFQDSNILNYYEWMQFGCSVFRIITGKGNVNDYMTSIGKLVSCVDKYNIYSTQLAVIEEELGEMAKIVGEHYGQMYLAMVWDMPIEKCNDKLVGNMSLYELIEYEPEIKASFRSLDKKKADEAYDYIVAYKRCYIDFLILNPKMTFEEYRDLINNGNQYLEEALSQIFCV